MGQKVNFPGQVAGQMSLQGDPRFGIGREIALQCPNLPTDGADRLHYYGIHVGRHTAQQKCGTNDVTRDQVSKDTFVPRHTHFPPHNEGDLIETLAMLYQSLTRLSGGPSADAQDVQDFPRWQILEDEPSHLLLFRCQFDRTTFEEETP